LLSRRRLASSPVPVAPSPTTVTPTYHAFVETNALMLCDANEDARDLFDDVTKQQNRLTLHASIDKSQFVSPSTDPRRTTHALLAKAPKQKACFANNQRQFGSIESTSM
jgi:hypothetical protein